MLQARPTNLASGGYCSPGSGVRGAPPTPISPRPARGQRHPTHSGGRINQRPRRRQTRKMNRNNTEYNQRSGERDCDYAYRALRKEEHYGSPPGAPQNASSPATEYPSPRSSGDRLGAMARCCCCVSWVRAPVFRSEPAAGLPRFSDHADPPVAPLAHYSESLIRSVSGFVFETCPRSPGKAATEKKCGNLESRNFSGAS